MNVCPPTISPNIRSRDAGRTNTGTLITTIKT